MDRVGPHKKSLPTCTKTHAQESGTTVGLIDSVCMHCPRSLGRSAIGRAVRAWSSGKIRSMYGTLVPTHIQWN